MTLDLYICVVCDLCDLCEPLSLELRGLQAEEQSIRDALASVNSEDWER